VTERKVINMMRRGDLRDVSCDRWRRIDPTELATRIANQPLALAALAAIIEGRYTIERVAKDEDPRSLIETIEAIW
jgi:hypothetical protein